MQIPRNQLQHIQQNLRPSNVSIIYGPRQVGKTTLVKQLISESGGKSRFVAGDDLKYAPVLSSQNTHELAQLVASIDLLVIDEAQKINNIGSNLKLLVDHFPQLSIIATGSASFELANKINEPLTGRKATHLLYPISYSELSHTMGAYETRQQLTEQMIWGSYPQILKLSSAEDKDTYLRELVGSYLYSDILEFEGIKKSQKIVDLLRLLAYQIGQNVSISELASNLSMDARTVNKYLDLLEKTFVIYYRGGYARNLRKEINKTGRYYFFDNGVRNTLINNFNPINTRADVGQLWENYLSIERLKYQQDSNLHTNSYFWRTYDGAEVDLVEERAGQLSAYEFKWQAAKTSKSQIAWQKTYPQADYQVINRQNFESFVSDSAT